MTKIFSWGFGDNNDNNDDDNQVEMSEVEKIPPEVEAAMEGLAEALTEFIIKKDHHGGDTDEEKAKYKADHDRYDQLQEHMTKGKGTSTSKTDGYKLRAVAMTVYAAAFANGECIHDNLMAEDILGMADRLDELDLKESEIGSADGH